MNSSEKQGITLQDMMNRLSVQKDFSLVQNWYRAKVVVETLQLLNTFRVFLAGKIQSSCLSISH